MKEYDFPGNEYILVICISSSHKNPIQKLLLCLEGGGVKEQSDKKMEGLNFEQSNLIS